MNATHYSFCTVLTPSNTMPLRAPLFRIKRGDGKYLLADSEGSAWIENQFEATLYDPTLHSKEQIIEAFAWILAVDVTAEDVQE